MAEYARRQRRGRRNPSEWGETEDYSETILKEYGNSYWRENWWREVIQNSVDNGGTLVNLNCVTNTDGTRVCSCEDNGSGMNYETLVLKFLRLGGSGKKGGGFAGGFGKAKELIFLPWLNYTIESRNARIIGSGKQATFTCIPCNEQMPFVKTGSPESLEWVARHKNCKSARTGTKLSVTMNSEKYTYEAYAKAYIQKCYLPNVTFRVNGSVIKAGLAADPNSLTADFAGMASVYAVPLRDRSKDSFIYVRVRGQYMFGSELDSDVHSIIIVEVTRPAVDVLTMNRNGFGDWTLSQYYENYKAKLASDVSSALRKKNGIIRETHRGLGHFKAQTRIREVTNKLDFGTTTKILHAKPVEVVKKATIDAVLEEVEVENKNQPSEGESINADDFVGPSQPAAARAMLQNQSLTITQTEAAIKQLLWKPDFMLYNDVPNLKLSNRYRPAGMTEKLTKLLKVFTELCRYVMIQCGAPENFGVGFCISPVMGGCYCHKESEHWILINPLAKTGDYAETVDLTMGNVFDIESIDTIKWLYAVAIHEVSHFANGMVGYDPREVDKLGKHNERFTSAMTHNMVLCVDGWDRVVAITNAVTKGAEIKLEAELELDVVSSRASKIAKAKRGGDPSPNLTMLSDSSVVIVNGVRRGVWNQRSVADYVSNEIDYSYARGQEVKLEIDGTDNVFYYKIGERGAKKDIALFVRSEGTPQTEQKRTRKPSPELVYVTGDMRYTFGSGEGSVNWLSSEVIAEQFTHWSGQTVQQITQRMLDLSYHSHVKIETNVGVYVFKRGKNAANRDKAVYIRENPAY